MILLCDPESCDAGSQIVRADHKTYMTNRENYHQLRKQVLELVGAFCERCGYNDCTEALCIISPATGSFVKRFKAIIAGAPCKILCANCLAIDKHFKLTTDEMKEIAKI